MMSCRHSLSSPEEDELLPTGFIVSLGQEGGRAKAAGFAHGLNVPVAKCTRGTWEGHRFPENVPTGPVR